VPVATAPAASRRPGFPALGHARAYTGKGGPRVSARLGRPEARVSEVVAANGVWSVLAPPHTEEFAGEGAYHGLMRLVNGSSRHREEVERGTQRQGPG
jgi:hypothetical protein